MVFFKPITVSEDVYNRILAIKQRHKLKSLNSALKELLDFWEMMP